MLWNRTIYLAALAAAIGFYTASGVWFSWALIFVLLILPPVSLLCSLPQMLRLRLSLSAPQRVEQGEAAPMRVAMQAFRLLPMCRVSAQMRVGWQGEPSLSRIRLRQIAREGCELRVEAEQPGLLTCSLRRVRVCDYLGLIRLPKRSPAARCAVLPTPEEPKPAPDLQVFRARRMQSLPQGSFSEDHDHRPYRPGDNARSIHWKLSQKSDELIVREPVEPVRLRSVVALDPPQTLPALRGELRRLRGLMRLLQAENVSYTLVWAVEEGTALREIDSEETALDALAECCAAPLFPGEKPALAVPDADWSFRVRADGEAAP